MRRLALVGLAIGSVGVVAACTPIEPPPPEPVVVEVPFAFVAPDGAPELWQVPAGVDEITVTAYGAAGGNGLGAASVPGENTQAPGGTGGLGGSVKATVSVAPEEMLQVNVGGRGADGDISFNDPLGGFNGGGPGGSDLCVPDDVAVAAGAGGGGGGASDVRRGDFLAGRLVVAGGGGGGGSPYALTLPLLPYQSVTDGGSGGGGGGPTGVGGSGALPGGGATESVGGIGGSDGADPGVLGHGGFGDDESACVALEYGAVRAGGGGGGGSFGGGGGGVAAGGDPPEPNESGGGGGGGGSGFPADAEFQTGVRAGNGRVVISYVAP